MSKLEDVCNYVNEKADVSTIDIDKYIANDNMLKNKKGIRLADIFPSSGKVVKFKKNDILIGNIRPYFKKIWKATFDGGCSQDVLVFRTKENISANYLYSILASDRFFEYVMLAPKGSKMPRGDKDHIMRYEFEIGNNYVAIGNYINIITKKMINNEILLTKYNELIDIIYHEKFCVFDDNFKLIYNEKVNRKIPIDWNVYDFNHLPKCEIIKNGVNYFDKKNYLATANINEEIINDGKDISYAKRENRANMQPVKNSIWFAKMKDSIKRICLPQNSDWFINKYILSTGFFGIKCDRFLLPYIYSFISFDTFETEKDKLAHGDTQQAINSDDLNYIYIPVPSSNEIKEYYEIVSPILEHKMNLLLENQNLYELRELALNSLLK